MRVALATLLAIVLTGCKTAQPEPPVIVHVTPEPVRVARECLDADPYWQDLPDRDVTLSDGVRNYATNRASYRRILHNRAVCRASIKSHGLLTQ